MTTLMRLMLPDARLVRAAVIKAEPDIVPEAVDYIVGQWNARRVVVPHPPNPASLSIYAGPDVSGEEAAAIVAEFNRLRARPSARGEQTDG